MKTPNKEEISVAEVPCNEDKQADTEAPKYEYAQETSLRDEIRQEYQDIRAAYWTLYNENMKNTEVAAMMLREIMRSFDNEINTCGKLQGVESEEVEPQVPTALASLFHG